MGDSIPIPDGPDVDIGNAMMKTIWSLYAITIVVVGTRLYTQWRITKQFGLGDALMTLSVACGIVLCSMLTVQHHYGLGRHFYYLDAHQRVFAIKFNFIGQAFGIMAPTFGRMASVIMMLQLFGTTKWRVWGLWTLFWQSLIVNGLTLIFVFAQCKDVRTIWDATDHPSACWPSDSQAIIGFVQGGLNAATDIFLTALPTTFLWSLKIGLKLKFGLAILLGLSILAAIAVIIKTVELQYLGNRGDITHNTVSLFTWVVVECTLVNIAASVPLIRPLFRKAKKSVVATLTNTYEMKNRYASGKKRNRLHSITDLETGVQNSSEENILPLESAAIDKGRQNIVKETTYDVSYLQKGSPSIQPAAGVKAEVWTQSSKDLPPTSWPPSESGK